MSSSFPKVKGFKKDKRSLIESTNNLVVFGNAQTPQEITGVKGRRLLRRGGLRQRRSSRPKSMFPPGPCSTTQKLDKLVQRVDLTNYFENTKPWNDPSYKKSSTIQQHLQHLTTEDSLTEITAVDTNTIAILGKNANSGGEVMVDLSSLQLPEQHGSVNSSNIPSPDHKTCPSITFVDSIVCPVCLKGFEPLTYSNVPVSELMKHSLAAYQQQNGTIFKKNLEEGWGSTAKPKYQVEPQDVVVAGNCGELFHRLCLRDWCARGHRKSPRSKKPVANCPSCNKELKYTMCQEIEIIRCFSRDHTMLCKEFIKVKHVNKELHILWPETNTYLARIKREIRDTETLYNELRSKRRGVKSELKKLTTDDLSIVMANVTDVNTLKSSLAKQEKALSFMQQETLQIMRMYLLTIIRKLKTCPIPIPSSGDFTSIPEYSSLIGRVPPQLVPYLQDIVNDDHALSIFSRVLSPYRDDIWDESQQKYLELELIQKFAALRTLSPPNLTRPNTYVVSSSAPEVGDSDSDDIMAKKLLSSSSIEGEEAIIPASSLKASTATHDISTIPSYSMPQNILRAGTISSMSVACRDKPPRLLDVVKIEASNSTIDSSLLEKKLMGLVRSPHGGGSVDNTYIMGPTSPSLSSPSSNQMVFDIEDSSLFQISRISKESLASPMDPILSLQQYEQDSKYVRAIRQLMKQSSIEAPPTTPQTITINSENSVVLPAMPKAALTQDIIKIHTGCTLGSGQPSSTNSETNQLNDMLIAFMRQQQARLEPYFNHAINGNESDKQKSANSTPEVHASILENKSFPPPHPSPSQKNSENSSNGGGIGSALSEIANKGGKEGSSWATVSPKAITDNDAASDKKFKSHSTPPSQEIKLPDQPICNKPKSLESHKSCQPIYTEGYQKRSPTKVAQCDSISVGDVSIAPRSRTDEVSIAIMYVIEDEYDDGDDSDVESSKSSSEDDLEQDSHLHFSEDDNKELLPLPLPTKVLSPIYLTAEKTSNYSIIANESGSADSKCKHSNDLFDSIIWPRQSRMIPVDTPSNLKTNYSHQDTSSTFNNYGKNHLNNFNNIQLTNHRNSLTTLPLPPLPEEILRNQERKSEIVVPTVVFEDETGQKTCNNNNNNKKLPAD